MKKIVITKNQLKLLREQLDNIETKEDIFNYLRSLPKKFKIQTKYGYYPIKIYDDGFSTAINYNPITKLYLDIFRAQKKTTTLMPIPDNIDVKPYNILNDIIKAVQKFPVEVDNDKTIQIGNMTKEQQRKLDNGLVTALCHQLMCALLYEDYFNTDFSRGNVHKEVQKLNVPQTEEDITVLSNQLKNKESVIRHILFFADTDPIIRLIESH
jgi:hypothetical protein